MFHLGSCQSVSVKLSALTCLRLGCSRAAIQSGLTLWAALPSSPSHSTWVGSGRTENAFPLRFPYSRAPEALWGGSVPAVGTGPSSSLGPQPRALGAGLQRGDGFGCKAALPSLQVLGRGAGDVATASRLSCFGGWVGGLGDRVGELRAHGLLGPRDVLVALLVTGSWEQTGASTPLSAPRCQHPTVSTPLSAPRCHPWWGAGLGAADPCPPPGFLHSHGSPHCREGWMESWGDSRCSPRRLNFPQGQKGNGARPGGAGTGAARGVPRSRPQPQPRGAGTRGGCWTGNRCLGAAAAPGAAPAVARVWGEKRPVWGSSVGDFTPGISRTSPLRPAGLGAGCGHPRTAARIQLGAGLGK